MDGRKTLTERGLFKLAGPDSPIYKRGVIIFSRVVPTCVTNAPAQYRLPALNVFVIDPVSRTVSEVAHSHADVFSVMGAPHIKLITGDCEFLVDPAAWRDQRGEIDVSVFGAKVIAGRAILRCAYSADEIRKRIGFARVNKEVE